MMTSKSNSAIRYKPYPTVMAKCDVNYHHIQPIIRTGCTVCPHDVISVWHWYCPREYIVPCEISLQWDNGNELCSWYPVFREVALLQGNCSQRSHCEISERKNKLKKKNFSFIYLQFFFSFAYFIQILWWWKII